MTIQHVHRTSLGIIALFCALIGGTALAGPKFKDTSTDLGTLRAGQYFEIDLRTLLKDPGLPPLNWFASATLPPWLKLDSQNSRLSGTPAPADAGEYAFTLSVTDSSGEGGDINHPARIAVTAPPQWKQPRLDLGIANEAYPFTFDLNTAVDNPAGGNLTFEARNLPGWLKLDPNTGVLSGTPRRQHVGDFDGVQVSATSRGGTSTVEAYGTVLITLQKPKWTAASITLPENPEEDSPFSRDLSEFVVNPERFPLEYEIISQTPPPWLEIGRTSGTLYGTPDKRNLGSDTVTVAFHATIDGKAYTQAATFKFEVIHVNHAPRWVTNPIRIPDALSQVAYRQPLRGSVREIDDGDTLTFEIVAGSGPAWGKISPDGDFHGTPAHADAGSHSWQVKVTDSAGASDTTTLELTVIRSNEPPRWVTNPVVLPDGAQSRSYHVDLNQRKYVMDPDGDPLTFSLLSPASWFTLSAGGVLVGRPGAGDVGVHRFQVQVSDNNSGTAVADLTILVAKTNQAPQWVLNPIRFTVKEDEDISRSIAQYARDPDGDELTFSAIAGQPWVKLSPQGVFTGKPGPVQVGDNPYTVRVADPDGLFADVEVVIEVLHVNHQPFWTQSPVKLPDAPERAHYSQNLADYAKDPDNDPLTFTRLSGPEWITLSPAGTLQGTPVRSDVGPNHLRVRISDPSGSQAEVNVVIQVPPVNVAPRWRQNPILMADAEENRPYGFDLSRYAADDDGDRLSFRLVEGPEWMKVTPEGTVTGTPGSAHVGDFTAKFAVSDPSGAEASTDGIGQVLDVNESPIVSAELPRFEVKERSTLRVALHPQYVKDPDGDPLNFVLEDSVSWVRLSSGGELTLDRPAYSQVGDHTFRFKVDDGKIAVHGTLQVRVLRDPRPPVWDTDPVRLTAKTNEPMQESLVGFARDLDGIRLSFSKVSGPDWLTVDGSGRVGGTPRNEHLGQNVFIVKACNDALCAEAGLVVQVVPGTNIDTIVVDSAVPGARAENLWIVDNSYACDQLIRSLRTNIGHYYNTLKARGIQHTGVYLSADAHRWAGLPIQGAGQEKLIHWTASDPAADFRARLDNSYSSSGCGNCYNSPIWAMHLFLGKLPGMTDLYQKQFFEPEVPMEVMLVTRQLDHYRWYARYVSAYQKHTAADFADEFTRVHREKGKALRIHAIAPACPSLLARSGDPNASGPVNAYQVLTRKTGGDYYDPGCNYPLQQFLTQYAERVASRAYILAKRRIPLTQTPIELATIQVWLGDRELPGNSGSEEDAWRFDASRNEILMRWNKVDLDEVKSGTELRVQYRVS